MMTNDDADANEANANASDDSSGLSSEAQAFILVIAAGLCTSVGAAVVFFPRLANLANRTTLAISLGFASGVMLYVSLVQIYKKSVGGYVESGLDDQTSLRYATFTFFGGCIIMMILDKFVDWLLKCEDEKGSTTTNTTSNIDMDMDMDGNEDKDGSNGGSSNGSNGSNGNVNQAEITAAGAGRHHHKQHQHLCPNCSHNRQQQQQHEDNASTTTRRCGDGDGGKHGHGHEHGHEQEQELPAVAGIIDGLAKHPGDELDEMRRQFVEKVKQDEKEKEQQEQKQEESGREVTRSVVGTTNTDTDTNTNPDPDIEAGSGAAVAAVASAVVEKDSSGEEFTITTVAAGTTMLSNSFDNNNNTNDNPKEQQQPKKLRSMGFAMALAIGIHNFPEGMASYLAYQADPAVGIALAIGIAFHNIPEGLCVSMPLYYATSRRWYSFWWGALSGLTEPLGALFAWLVLQNGLDGTTNGILFGIVAGMMTVISIQELLPNAHKYARNGSTVTYSFLSGAFIIALSIMLFPAE